MSLKEIIRINSGIIEDKILNLPLEEFVKFNKTLVDYLYNKEWCEINLGSYVNPNISLAKEILFKEMYKEN